MQEPDYSVDWLLLLSEAERNHWQAKSEELKEWWAWNTRAQDRPMAIRTEIEAAAFHKRLLDMPVSKHQEFLDAAKHRSDKALQRLRERHPDLGIPDPDNRGSNGSGA